MSGAGWGNGAGWGAVLAPGCGGPCGWGCGAVWAGRAGAAARAQRAAMSAGVRRFQGWGPAGGAMPRSRQSSAMMSASGRLVMSVSRSGPSRRSCSSAVRASAVEGGGGGGVGGVVEVGVVEAGVGSSGPDVAAARLRLMASSTARRMRLRAAARWWAGSLAGCAGMSRVRARAMQRRTARAMRSKAVAIVMRSVGVEWGGDWLAGSGRLAGGRVGCQRSPARAGGVQCRCPCRSGHAGRRGRRAHPWVVGRGLPGALALVGQT